MSRKTPVDTFLQEANDLVEVLEEKLLALEEAPERGDLVDAVFRVLHTLKGSGEMFGFSALAGFVHMFENAYDDVRSGRATVTPELIEVSLASRDHIGDLVAAGSDAAAAAAIAGSAPAQGLLRRIAALTGASHTAAHAAPVEAEAAPSAAQRYVIRFKPDASALRNGMRPELLIEELSQLGTTGAQWLTDDVPALEALDPASCYLAWRIEIETAAGRDAINDVFIFADDGDLQIDDAAHETAAAAVAAPVAAANAKPVARAAAKADPAEGGEAGGNRNARNDSVRVQSHRLDALMDQLGELVIAQARLNRISLQLADPALAAAAEEIERLVTGLRDAALSIRMLPIGTVFGKFRRVVRDLSVELGKHVSLDTEGGETELDENVIDSLTEPLVHIIRNSVDHGIEPTEKRTEAGKSVEATIRMVARQTGGDVLVTVSDDGGGLNTDAIRNRAVERGLIAEDAGLTDEQLHQLIFEPGFSTAAVVSSVSGRGVGMDAVRSVIGNLRGSVEVKSKRGIGTDVTLRLPLTLAIINGLMVRVGDAAFVLPLSSVEECVELSVEESRRESGRTILNIRNELVPFLNVEELFGFPPSVGERRRIVIVSAEGRRVGLVVDDIIGQHQTVVKSLSVYHRGIQGLAGGTILGDGSVALILDPVALVKRAITPLRDAA